MCQGSDLRSKSNVGVGIKGGAQGQLWSGADLLHDLVVKSSRARLQHLCLPHHHHRIGLRWLSHNRENNQRGAECGKPDINLLKEEKYLQPNLILAQMMEGVETNCQI